MPNTQPAVDEATAVEFVHRMGRQARKTYVYVMGAITKERKGKELAEIGLMSQAGAIGFTDDGGGVQDASVMLRAMKYVSMFDRVISQHCQDDTLAGGVTIGPQGDHWGFRNDPWPRNDALGICSFWGNAVAGIAQHLHRRATKLSKPNRQASRSPAKWLRTICC
jgi:dihydroorotase-like cyclic amidohydrolase